MTMKVHRKRRVMIVILVCLLVIGTVFCITIIGKASKEKQQNEDSNVEKCILNTSEKISSEEDKEQRIEEYYKQQIEEALSKVDWTGREDEKEEYRRKLMDDFAFDHKAEH